MPGLDAAEPGAPDLAISVVVPMLDASARLDRLHRWLDDALSTAPRPAEVILVDDGSTDRTWDAITALVAADDRCRGVRLETNVGQTGALCAGFSVARGAVVVMLDDDIEAAPGDLVRFVDGVESGADFVSGWRIGARAPIRGLGSAVYNRRIRSWGLPFHDAGCGVNAMTLDVARRMAAEGWGVHQFRFKPTAARMAGTVAEVHFPVRRTDASNYPLAALAASWLDVEMTVGGLSRRRFGVMAIAAPLAVSGLAAWQAPRGRHPISTAAVALGAATSAAAATRILRRRDATLRRALTTPPFKIAERAPASA